MLDLLLLTRKRVPGIAVTYQDFLDYMTQQNITALASNSSFGAVVAYRKVALTTNDGTMWGTPWQQYFTTDSTVARVMRHCFPDQATCDDNFLQKRTVMVKTTTRGTINGFQSRARNGYTSTAYTQFAATTVVDFIYFDATLGQVMRLNPFGDGIPKAFDKVLV